jgi:hypothetical protein
MVTSVDGNSQDYLTKIMDDNDPKETPQDLKNKIKAMLIIICDAVVSNTTADVQTNAKEMKAGEQKSEADQAEAKDGQAKEAAAPPPSSSVTTSHLV